MTDKEFASRWAEKLSFSKQMFEEANIKYVVLPLKQ